jgi:hypothetical protein
MRAQDVPMADTLLFDKLAYVDRLIKPGIDGSQARAPSDALDEALKESVATKADIARLQHKIDLLGRDLTVRVGVAAREHKRLGPITSAVSGPD